MVVSTRLEPEEAQALEDYAAKRAVSRSTAAANLIRSGLKRAR